VDIEAEPPEPEDEDPRPNAWIAPIELEPEFRAILAAQQGKP